MTNDIAKGATFAADEFTENTDYHALVDNGTLSDLDRDGVNQSVASFVEKVTAPGVPYANEFLLEDGLVMKRYNLANATFDLVKVNKDNIGKNEEVYAVRENFLYGNVGRFVHPAGMNLIEASATQWMAGVCIDLDGISNGATGNFATHGLREVQVIGTPVRGDFVENSGTGTAFTATNIKTLNTLGIVMSNTISNGLQKVLIFQ